MYGYPGSGKTHFAERLCLENNWFHLASDRLRRKIFKPPQYTDEERVTLFDFADYLAEEFVSKEVSVVYDANFNFKKDRDKLKKIAKKRGATYKIVWIKTDEKQALKRLKDRYKKADSKSKDIYRPIDEAIFYDLKSEMEVLTSNEAVIIIDGTLSFKKQLAEFNKQI